MGWTVTTHLMIRETTLIREKYGVTQKHISFLMSPISSFDEVGFKELHYFVKENEVI